VFWRPRQITINLQSELYYPESPSLLLEPQRPLVSEQIPEKISFLKPFLLLINRFVSLLT
jgi:hypothetical protein